ncbi:MAG: LPS export ABC transporter periplasmic protein LptC [Elusimicrobiales bacterium]
MILRFKAIFVVLFLCSCSKKIDFVPSPSSFIRDLSISLYESNKIRWRLNCQNAELNEQQNTLKCYIADILTYSNGNISSDMKAEIGYADLREKLFFLKGNAQVFSRIQNAKVISEKIYFNYQNNTIYSDTNTIIFKDNIKTESEGFEAKSNLSNIKIKKHRTTIE